MSRIVAADRPASPDDLKVEERLKDTPPIHATPHAARDADSQDEYDFAAFAWTNPRGLWKPSA